MDEPRPDHLQVPLLLLACLLVSSAGACTSIEETTNECFGPKCDAAGESSLRLGDSVVGQIEADDGGIDYSIELAAGDVIELSVTAVSGDLQPAAYLHTAAAFVEPASYQVGDQRVDLNFSIDETTTHEIRVRAHHGQGTGRFILRSRCVVGPCASGGDSVELRLLAINDLHGALEPGASSGGGAFLSAHVKRQRDQRSNSIFVSAGDLVGASPYISARFHDEATIELMNHMKLDLNAVGNHEFDEGLEEVVRLRDGGCHPADGCAGRNPYSGAEFAILGANVIDDNGQPALPPYTVREFEGIPVAFIGMTLEQTRSVTVASFVEDLDFLDEVQTVRNLVPEIRAAGIEAIVVIVHQGGVQDGDANDCENLSGRIVGIAEMVDPAVDAVISGHSHRTYNCNFDGLALTSAGSHGRWFSQIDFQLSRATRDATVVAAVNLPVDHSISPDPTAESIISFYRDIVDVEVNEVVGATAGPLSNSSTSNGLSPLGLAIADSQRFAAIGADIAFMNQGGIRASLPGGSITFGEVFATQPFENPLVTMTLSGSQLQSLLRSQFTGTRFAVLQPSSSLRYRIQSVNGDIRLLEGSVEINGAPLIETDSYRVTANAFLAGGGDGFPEFLEGTERAFGAIDFRAFLTYLEATNSPLPVPALDRISF